MVEKYNQKYSDLTNEDKEVVKILISNDNNKKNEFYQKEVNECVGIIDNLIQISEGEEKEKLLKVKTKLQEEEKEIEGHKFLDKISKLIELKNSLK